MPVVYKLTREDGLEYIINHVKSSQMSLVTSGRFKFEELKSKMVNH